MEKCGIKITFIYPDGVRSNVVAGASEADMDRLMSVAADAIKLAFELKGPSDGVQDIHIEKIEAQVKEGTDG